MDKVIDGRMFVSQTLAEQLENLDWQVVVTMVEKRRVSGDDWEEVKFETSCTDRDFEKAYMVAWNATIGKFNDALEERGTGSLFDDIVEDTESSQ